MLKEEGRFPCCHKSLLQLDVFVVPFMHRITLGEVIPYPLHQSSVSLIIGGLHFGFEAGFVECLFQERLLLIAGHTESLSPVSGLLVPDATDGRYLTVEAFCASVNLLLSTLQKRRKSFLRCRFGHSARRDQNYQRF